MELVPLLTVTFTAAPLVDWSASNELVATLTVSIASMEGMYWIVSDAPKFRVPAPSTRVSLLLMFPPLTVNASERVGLAPKEWPLVGGDTPGMVVKSIW